jgi:uncharacterized protein YecE (DUF72 family)
MVPARFRDLFPEPGSGLECYAARFNAAEINSDVAYYRLHGSPQMYRSPYERSVLADLADRLNADRGADGWCIFDNTASGAALGNALELLDLVGEPRCVL